MRSNIFLNTKGIFLLGLFIMSLKLFLIDMDPPVWKEALYQPIDEPYYVYPAYNFYETGDLFVADDAAVFGNSILLNAFTYLSLRTFGDNFLGLRFSSIFFGLITLYFFILLLKRITTSVMLQYAVVLFFALNFSFTTANLIVEPTMVRMMTAILCLWLVVRWNEDQIIGANLIWQSALVCFLFLISYPTNAFLILATYIPLVLCKAPDKKNGNENWINFDNFWRGSFYFGMGVLIALGIYYLFNLAFEVDVLSDVFSRGSKYEERTGFNPRDLVVNFLKLILANSFRFNPLWLVISAMSIGSIFLAKWKRLNLTVLITLIFVGSFVLQSMFINDYPWRKLILFLPFLLLLTTYGLQIIISRWNVLNSRVLFQFFVVGLLALILLLYWEQPFFGNHLFSLITCGLGLIIIFFVIIKKQMNKMVPFFLFFLLLLPEVYYTTKNYFVHSTYHYKNMYKSLSAYDGYEFIGGSSMGFRVYNKTVPLSSKYLYFGGMEKFWQKTDSLSNNGKKDYSIDYDYMEKDFNKINFRPVKVIMPKEESVWDYDLILYEEVILK